MKASYQEYSYEYHQADDQINQACKQRIEYRFRPAIGIIDLMEAHSQIHTRSYHHDVFQ